MQAAALAHWRQAGRVVKKQSVLKKLFDVIAPQYLERNGGYTRILHLSRRQGDNAQTVLLELVGVSEKRAEQAPTEKKGGKKAKKKRKLSKSARAAGRKKAKATPPAFGRFKVSKTKIVIGDGIDPVDFLEKVIEGIEHGARDPGRQFSAALRGMSRKFRVLEPEE